MRALASAFIILLGPASLLADGRSELDILRSRCTEQERQIRSLETEIENLHSQLALERRRSRGVPASASTTTVSATAPSPESPAPVATYTVKAGDTLSSIARRYRTSADELMKRNGIKDATRMRVGQELKLPAEAKAPAPRAALTPKVEPEKITSVSKPAPKTTADESSAYKVQRGDTLYGIARKHKMSVSALRSLNPKVENKIVVGQNLVISGKPSSPTPSLGSAKTVTIATRASTPAPAPKAAPAKKAAEKPKTKPTEAKVEKKEEPEPTAAPEPNPAPAPKTISSIIVMDEISFGDFAKKHGTTPDQLNALNGWDFKSNLVLARGSEIYVPGQ